MTAAFRPRRHTEAAVDISGWRAQPAWRDCEIANDDGTMARLPDLIQFRPATA